MRHQHVWCQDEKNALSCSSCTGPLVRVDVRPHRISPFRLNCVPLLSKRCNGWHPHAPNRRIRSRYAST